MMEHQIKSSFQIDLIRSCVGPGRVWSIFLNFGRIKKNSISETCLFRIPLLGKSPIYWHNSTLLPVTQYHFIPSSTKLYWPSTTMYQPVPPHIDQLSYISFGLVQVLFFYIYNVGFLTSALDCNETGFISFDRLKSFHGRLWLYYASFPCLRLIDFLFMDNI